MKTLQLVSSPHAILVDGIHDYDVFVSIPVVRKNKAYCPSNCGARIVGLYNTSPHTTTARLHFIDGTVTTMTLGKNDHCLLKQGTTLSHILFEKFGWWYALFRPEEMKSAVI